jgi:hypothetical protein
VGDFGPGISPTLAPTVCLHFFDTLSRGLPLPANGVVTARCNCFRNERGNRSATSLDCFDMREIIFVGPRARVEGQLQRACKWATALLSEIGLPFRLETAFDSFFDPAMAVARGYQMMSGSKIECRAELEPGASVALGSINAHGASLLDGLELQVESDPLVSGCMGFGLERLALAMLQASGGDFARARSRAATPIARQ